MREVVLIVLGVVLLGLLLYGFGLLVEREKQRQAELEQRVRELAGRESVTLTDFIALLGDPDSVSRVSCGGSQCLKAIWDLSFLFVECWKRLIVVLDEEQQRVFLLEYKDLEAMEVVREGEEEVLCVEVP